METKAATPTRKIAPNDLDTRYLIQPELIGKGSFSKVFLGLEIGTERKVAVKVIDRSRIRYEDNGYIDNELQILKKLNHPNIVRTLYMRDGWPFTYIVFEYITGKDLLHIVDRDDRLPEPQARMYFSQLVSAVDYAHSLGIAHRDIKPENILVDKFTSRLVLIDFGLSSFMQPGTTFQDYCGSPSCAAPELVQHIPYTGRATDIWAMGCVLYIMLCGAHPFNGEDLQELSRKIIYKEPEFPTGLSEQAKDLLRKMLEKNPCMRITMSEIKRHPWLRAAERPTLKDRVQTLRVRGTHRRSFSM